MVSEQALEDKGGDYYPIREVANQTGVNPITIRAWERRYQLLSPKRTPKGHRLYDEDDIQTIKYILFLMSKGYPVGKVKPLLKERLPYEQLVASKASLHENYQQLVVALQKANTQQIQDEINRLFALYSPEIFASQIYPEVMKYLNNIWLNSPCAEVEKELFLQALQFRLTEQLVHFKEKTKKPPFLVIGYKTSMVIDRQIKGLLLAAILQGYGHKVVFVPGTRSPESLATFLAEHQTFVPIVFTQGNAFDLGQLNRTLGVKSCYLFLTQAMTVSADWLSMKVLPTRFESIYAALEN